MTLGPRVDGGVATLVRDISGESCSKEGKSPQETESGRSLKTHHSFNICSIRFYSTVNQSINQCLELVFM